MGLCKWVFALSAVGLLGCNPPHPEPPDPQDVDPDAVAKAMVDATNNICLPYVIDGANIDAITNRSGITKRVQEIHGQAVTRYDVIAPGHPTVTVSMEDNTKWHSTGEAEIRATTTECHIDISLTPDLAMQVFERLHGHQIIAGYKTKPAHDAPRAIELTDGTPLDGVCIHGRRPALFSIVNPDAKNSSGAYLSQGFLEIMVDGDLDVGDFGCT